MKDVVDEMHYYAGYPDKDSMREKAEKLMREEMMTTQMNKPGSFSEPGREKMRLYKKGGHVHHHHHHEGKEKKRAHLHKLQREGLHETEHALAQESHLSHGGHVHHKKHRGHHHHRHHEHHGHHHHHHEGKAHYPHVIEGGSLTDLHIPTPKLNVQSIKAAEMMKKGGHMGKHKHCGHKKVHKASGGTVYEHEMRGVHPTTHAKKINYEKDMRGVHPARVPAGKGARHKNPGGIDQSFGTVFKRGGKVCKKMAAGGAAKVRKGVATKTGQPIRRKVVMGY